MAHWKVTAHRDFPIWIAAHRIIDKKGLDGERVEWLVEATETILYFPKSRRGIQTVEPAEPEEAEAA